MLEAVAFGTLSSSHAGQFKAFIKQIMQQYDVSAIIKGEARWPDKPEDRDVLYFLAQSFRAHLGRELPQHKKQLWLLEMGVGVMPDIGVLYDEALKGMSAESIYDIMIRDMRKYQREWTLRGKGLGDVMLPEHATWWRSPDGVCLDEFYRNCLAQGLDYHQSQERGFIAAGLVEEIQALSQPPIPWDVELARWFDTYFAPLEKRCSYARLSRRQSSTPDIPRPSWAAPRDLDQDRTFGVILDTSGSMDTALLAKGLGAIASYSLSREVALVRVVFCDAAYYDQGYMAPEEIANRVRVHGRGGTILQPAIDFLQQVPDFPKDGPLLIITDGYIDRLTIHSPRPHAYLVPKGHTLPFVPRGEVFYIS